MRRTAFTLSEILVILLIMIVLAAMVIPSLINNTKKHEYRSSLKKAFSNINKALTLNYALDGLSAQDYTSSEVLVSDLFIKRMNVIDIESEFTSPDCDGPVFTTADGIIFCISNYSSAYNDEKGTPCDFYNSEPCIQTAGPNLWIDVNGWSKPNKPTNSYDNPKDIIKHRYILKRLFHMVNLHSKLCMIENYY